MITPKFFPDIDTLHDVTNSQITLEALRSYFIALVQFPQEKVKGLLSGFQIINDTIEAIEFLSRKGN